MKEVFESKKKVLLFGTILFFFVSIIINLLPVNIKSITTGITYMLLFFLLSFLYAKKNKMTFEMPIYLMLIYMIIGYISLFDIMSGKKIIAAFVSSLLGYLVVEIQNRMDGKKYQKDTKEEKNKIIKNSKIIAYLIPLISLAILEISYKLCVFATPNLFIDYRSVFVTIVLVYLIYILLLSLFRTTHKATIAFSSIFLIIYIINQMRIYFTSDTLQITDILFLENTGEIASFMGVTLFYSILYILAPTVITIIIYYLLWKISKQNNIEYKNIKTNLLMFIPSITILLLLFIPFEAKDKFILNVFYDRNNEQQYNITASNTIFYKKYGVLSGMYGKFIGAQRLTPDNYDEEELKNELANAEKVESTFKKPNIIVIFSESFWDLGNLKEIEFDKDVTPNFHKIAEENKLIDMISPAYGGISANVEFEILTGGSLNYFSKGYTPYMQLFNNVQTLPSIIEEFRNNGYKTKILNSSSKNMFNCEKIYDYYKVDERNHLFDEIDLNGNYVTDAYLTDQMIDYFTNKPKDEKIFYFTITMGGHMPYYIERYDNYDIDIVKSPYNKEINETIKSYAEGMYLADKELGRLYDFINTLDEETMIIFFGDHLPHLQTKAGKDILFEINYLDYDYTLDSVYKQYNTRAVIASNYEINYDETRYLSPDLLLTYVLNNMDMEVSPYYKWLYKTKETLPSSNYVVSQDKNGKIYYTLSLQNEMKDTYIKREKMQYMLFR